MRRVLSRTATQREPHLIWNAFIDLVAVEAYEDLSDLQRKAHLVFWYDTEVQNGGHGQYFENHGTERAGEVIRALEELQLTCLAQVLKEAVSASADAQGNALDRFDNAYHVCKPNAIEGLEAHLTKYQAEYVELR